MVFSMRKSAPGLLIKENLTKGFWKTSSSWSNGSLGAANVYLDSNLNGIFDSADQLIGDVAGFWNGTYSGGVWNRIESLMNGYFGGSSFGQFRSTSQMTFDETEGNDLFAGSEGSDFIRGVNGSDEIYASNGNDDIRGN